MNYQNVVEFDKATGRVITAGSAQNPETYITDTTDVLIGFFATPGTDYVQEGVVVSRPTQPSIWHNFDWVTKLWVDPRTLQDYKAAQWLLIKQARAQAEYAGFTWDGSTFDSDTVSQNRITGAVTLAQMSTAFSIDWILANNTVRTLNQINMLQVGAALGNHVAEQFSKGVLLRNSIEYAATKEEIEAITWDTLL